MFKQAILTSCVALVATACTENVAPTVASVPFGQTEKGTPVRLYTLDTGTGMTARITNFGGTIVSLQVPDREGKAGDVVLGFDSLADYETRSPYFGALIGRYGNRIAGGSFVLDGERYELATNNGPNHLHGGVRGFDKVVWDADQFATDSTVGLVLTYTSPNGQEGYPGTLTTEVTYTLTRDHNLVIDYRATTDAPTPVNLTQHSYFNLGGHDAGDILDHEVRINADRFTPVDSTLIPTGELRSVAGTPFDFRTATAIGARLDQDNCQLRYGGGYDHNWVLNRPASAREPSFAARVTEPSSGRVMEILTTEPGLQFYSGNFLDGSLTGKDGARYGHRTGFAMETQHFPDSPNQAAFPPTILRSDETYRSRTIYRFSTEERG